MVIYHPTETARVGGEMKGPENAVDLVDLDKQSEDWTTHGLTHSMT